MIIKCVKVLIDTELGHVEHKKAIQKVTTFFCDKDDPTYWFTQQINGYQTFFHLDYNEKGDMLLKISSWESIPYKERKTKVVKYVDDKKACYFTKNDKEAHVEIRYETDYSAPSSRNLKTYYERKKNWLGRYKK